jgi:hypothetical protein
MIKAILLFAGAFGLCAAIGSASTGCQMDPDCGCPDIPDLPPAKPAEPATIVFGAEPSAPVVTANVTLEVKGTSVVIRYPEGVADIEVVYSVDPWPY